MSTESPTPKAYRGRLALGALALWGCYLYFGTPAQFMLDREVDRLCAKDGGMQIYEQVRLPVERFDERSTLKKGDPIWAGTDSEYKEDSFRRELKVGDPRLVEQRFRFIRVADNKVLGEEVLYTRVGGGLLSTAFQGNGYGCKESLDLPPKTTTLIHKIFVPISKK